MQNKYSQLQPVFLEDTNLPRVMPTLINATEVINIFK